MKILFVIDRIELKYFEFNDLVTNFWLIKSFLERGHEVAISTIDMLKLKSSVAYSSYYNSYLKDDNIFYDKDSYTESKIEDFDLVMFRPDPPVDLDYISATYIFDFVDRSKTFIMNDTTSIRNFNEKLHAVLFNEFMPKNIVTASKLDIIEFLKENGEIILKPLNQCYGSGVMYLKNGDKNTAVIIDSVTNKGKQLTMVQKYIKKAEFGDKRVLILGNEVLPYCVKKIPSNDDFKFCEHKDDCILKAELSDSEKEKFTKVAEKLNSLGIYMAGLDVIDEQIIEVNVTSPCYFIREINNHFACHVENEIINFILDKVFEHKKILAKV
jgi:glutathione synthase